MADAEERALWAVWAQHEDDDDGWQDAIESRAVAYSSEGAIAAVRAAEGYGDSWRVWTAERFLYSVAVEERSAARDA